MTDAMATLHQAAEIVRVQIPKGELTLASVKQLLQAAEAVCGTASSASSTPASGPQRKSKGQQTRARWAEIAQQNAAAGGSARAEVDAALKRLGTSADASPSSARRVPSRPAPSPKRDRR